MWEEFIHMLASHKLRLDHINNWGNWGTFCEQRTAPAVTWCASKSCRSCLYVCCGLYSCSITSPSVLTPAVLSWWYHTTWKLNRKALSWSAAGEPVFYSLLMNTAHLVSDCTICQAYGVEQSLKSAKNSLRLSYLFGCDCKYTRDLCNVYFSLLFSNSYQQNSLMLLRSRDGWALGSKFVE